MEFTLTKRKYIDRGERPPRPTAKIQRLSSSRAKVVNGRFVIRVPAQVELQNDPLGWVDKAVIMQHSNGKVSLTLFFEDGSFQRL